MRPKTVRCPVCDEKYLPHALNQHFSQMAGKEAQYLMAELYYNETLSVITIEKTEVMKKCPHWQYISERPVFTHKPVARKYATT